MNVFTLRQQAQDFLLRLFVEPTSDASVRPTHSAYTCAHCGTFSRLRQ